MDRRQKKTREAIFEAFGELLSKKDFNKITVAEIIERADVGRATFYAHFETKDYLLKELCEELFCHIFDSLYEKGAQHKHIFSCNAPDSVFLHLILHLQRNDNNILALLASQNNELFVGYFKEYLKALVEDRLYLFESEGTKDLPRDFMINHIASTFVTTIRWWADRGMKESPQTITEYFFKAVTL